MSALLFFVVYAFVCARPIPEETVLVKRWLSSLESERPVLIGEGAAPSDEGHIPFHYGERLGYIGSGGVFTYNAAQKGQASISADYRAEYDAQPESIDVFDPYGEPAMRITRPEGYPFFAGGRVFIIGKNQNDVSLLDSAGKREWTYTFSSPLTCADGANGYLLTGSLDGVAELLDAQGRAAMLPFEPGGSRLAVIVGCALSHDASRIALISGLEDQRFLLIDRSGGGAARVVHHEFLSAGYRRPVRVLFSGNNESVVYEREGGLGVYHIKSRESAFIPLDEEIAALDASGKDGRIFIVTAGKDTQRTFIMVQMPQGITLETRFRSRNVFLGRRGAGIYLGGDLAIASFALEKI
ncbi:MAG: WD40 repeat domain-containing protein [Treponema sp.]|nr:WD40 repeat domain-containing protein [Treponema sp.]